MQDGKLTVTVKIQVRRCCRSLHALCSARVLHVTYLALQSDLYMQLQVKFHAARHPAAAAAVARYDKGFVKHLLSQLLLFLRLTMASRAPIASDACVLCPATSAGIR